MDQGSGAATCRNVDEDAVRFSGAAKRVRDPRLALLPELGISAARAWALAMRSEECLGTCDFPETERALRRRSTILFEGASVAVLIVDEDPDGSGFGDVWAIAKGDVARVRRIGAVFGGLFYDLAAMDACQLVRDDAYDHGGAPAGVGAAHATWAGAAYDAAAE